MKANTGRNTYVQCNGMWIGSACELKHIWSGLAIGATARGCRYILRLLDTRGGRKLRTDRQAHIHTHGTTTVTLAD